MRVVLIEDASRFARDLITQELGIVVLVSRAWGFSPQTVTPVRTSDPSRVMMRQIAGAFAEYEKARLVARLRRAREINTLGIVETGSARSVSRTGKAAGRDWLGER